jgi:antibiotic biosynthesis monooxygenase (ABM) superfamily enzyme
MSSPEREQLIAKVQPLLAADDRYVVKSGLDFWFTPEGASIKVPTRWKQFVMTWSVIYPLVLIVPEIIIRISDRIGLPLSQYIVSLLATFIIVFLMIYAIMPRYTKLVSRWLYR